MSADAPAPYEIRAEPHPGYLRITMAGTRSTLAESIAGWREVGRLIAIHKATRVLVVSYLTGPMPSPEEQRATIRALAGGDFGGVRTAFVLQDARNVGAMEHGEMEARDLGQQSRVFGSEELALLWLQYT